MSVVVLPPLALASQKQRSGNIRLLLLDVEVEIARRASRPSKGVGQLLQSITNIKLSHKCSCSSGLCEVGVHLQIFVPERAWR